MLVDSTGTPFPAAALPPPRPQLSGFSAWFATQQNPGRKQLWTFDADPSGQLSPSARAELDILAQTLYKNSGLASAAKNIFRIVGSLKPQAKTGDPDYDARLEAAFKRVAESPLIFDAAGKETFYSYQLRITEERNVRGELFSIFTETTTGAARIAARGAHTVGGRPQDGSDAWRDGVLSDENGFPLAYHFTASRRNAARQVPSRVLDSAAVFHHHNFHGIGAQRGVTALAHAINHIRDIIAITAAQKQGILSAAEIAITRKADTAHNTTPATMGLGAQVTASPFAPPDFAGTPEAAEPSLPLSFEAFVQSGLFSSVPLDVLHDDRPHPNAMAFREELKREIANGFGVPPQVLYFMDDPGGAWSRILLEALVFFVAEQHFHLRQFCQRFWVYAISKEIKSGRLAPFPKSVSPDNMWKVRWMPPRSMTADIARVGRLTIDMRRTLLTTFAKHYEELGLDWEDELAQAAQELAHCRRLERDTEGLLPGDLTGWIYGPGANPAAANNNNNTNGGGNNSTGNPGDPSALADINEQLARLSELVATLAARRPLPAAA